MAWKIEFVVSAEKEFSKLNRETQQRIVKFFKKKITVNPRDHGKALKGSSDLVKLWRYRVGDYRMICQIFDKQVRVLVLRVAKRDSIYKDLS